MELPAVRRTRPITIHHRPKFFQQPMSNCYNGHMVNNNNNNMNKITYSTAGVLPPSLMVSLSGRGVSAFLVGEPAGVWPFNTIFRLGFVWWDGSFLPSLSRSRSLSFFFFLSLRLCSSLLSCNYYVVSIYLSIYLSVEWGYCHQSGLVSITSRRYIL